MDKYVLEFSSRATQNYFIHIFFKSAFRLGGQEVVKQISMKLKNPKFCV